MLGGLGEMGQGQPGTNTQEGQIDPPPTAKRSRNVVDTVEARDSHLGQSLLCASPWAHVGWEAFESCAGNGRHLEFRDNRAEVSAPNTPSALVHGGLTHLI